MIFPIYQPSEWSELYKINTKSGTCLKCQKEIVADIPFADGQLRGFISEDHGCGMEYRLLTFRNVKDRVLEDLMAGVKIN